MDQREVAAYLDDTRHVEGWFFPIDAYLFAVIDDIQKREGIEGNLFEIGVHHGKTAIFLARMLRPSELLGVCDVFEQQDENRDRSGEGSRELFLANLRAHAPSVTPRVFAKRSDQLTRDETTPDCRFFHIDGGHRPEDVVADLETALRAIHDAGVIAVDDLFNPNWPGVSEGFYRFIATHPDALTPIAIGGNKVLFTRPAAAARYTQPLAALTSPVAAYTFEPKEWLSHHVPTAVRRAWVDLDPAGAAQLHRP